MMSPARPDRELLFQLATEQRGYFTSAQARELGYSRALLAYHAKTGTLLRIYPGVYRFRDYPSSPREEIVPAWLTVGKDIAVVSHESALELWGLSDIIPDGVHLTVPRSRRSLPKLPGVTIHTTTRAPGPGDVRSYEGLRVTSPTRTILDVADADAAPDQIGLALFQTLERGWASREAIHAEASQRGIRTARAIDYAFTSGYPY